MRKSILVLVGLLTASVLVAQSSSPELTAFPPNKAKVYVDELSFDFGLMPNDASVSHSYWLHSRGEDSLKILRLKPACGCTKAPLTKEVIAPGDSGEVELVFKASPGQRGNVTKTATVTCNDNNKGNFQLSFSSKIYPKEYPDSLQPLTLSTGSVKWDQTSKSKVQSIELKNVSQSPINISIVARPKGFVELEMSDKEIMPGKTKELKFKISPEFTGQEFTKSFTFACTNAEKTRYSIPVVLAAQVAAVAPPLQKPTATKANAGEGSTGSN